MLSASDGSDCRAAPYSAHHMHASKAAVLACTLLIAGCANPGAQAPADDPSEDLNDDSSGDPVSEDCTDQEGPCTQGGAVTTPAPGETVDTGSAPVANSLPTHYPFRVLQLNLCNSGVAGCYQGGRSIP